MWTSEVFWTLVEKPEKSLTRVPISEGTLGEERVSLLMDVEKSQLILIVGNDTYVADMEHVAVRAIIAVRLEATEQLAWRMPREGAK